MIFYASLCFKKTMMNTFMHFLHIVICMVSPMMNKLHQSYCKCKDALHYLGNNAVFKILEAFSGPIAPQKCATKRCWQAKFILSICVPLCLQCYFRGTERHMQMHRVHEHMYAQAWIHITLLTAHTSARSPDSVAQLCLAAMSMFR